MSTAALFSLVEPGAALGSTILQAARHLFSTKQLAAITGVTIRTAQRWITGATQKRKPGAAALRKLARHLAWKVKIKAKIFTDTKQGKRTRYDTYKERKIDVILDPADVGKVQDELLGGHEDKAMDVIWDTWGFNPAEAEALLDFSIEGVQPA